MFKKGVVKSIGNNYGYVLLEGERVTRVFFLASGQRMMLGANDRFLFCGKLATVPKIGDEIFCEITDGQVLRWTTIGYFWQTVYQKKTRKEIKGQPSLRIQMELREAELTQR